MAGPNGNGGKDGNGGGDGNEPDPLGWDPEREDRDPDGPPGAGGTQASGYGETARHRADPVNELARALHALGPDGRGRRINAGEFVNAESRRIMLTYEASDAADGPNTPDAQAIFFATLAERRGAALVIDVYSDMAETYRVMDYSQPVRHGRGQTLWGRARSFPAHEKGALFEHLAGWAQRQMAGREAELRPVLTAARRRWGLAPDGPDSRDPASGPPRPSGSGPAP